MAPEPYSPTGNPQPPLPSHHQVIAKDTRKRKPGFFSELLDPLSFLGESPFKIGMIPEAREVWLTPKVRKLREALCRAPTTRQGEAMRARTVLPAARGRSTRSIAEEVGVHPRIVSNWRRRFAEEGLAGLKDRPRRSREPLYGPATNKRILAVLDRPPRPGHARRTGPLVAQALGDVDVEYVWRFLREHKIDLAARKSWCEGNAPAFVAKTVDVVDLYVDLPAKAIVLCVYEKPSIQALERMHPGQAQARAVDR